MMFSLVICLLLAMEKLFLCIELVIVDPAAIKTLSSIVNGAIKLELLPIKTLFPIWV